MHMWPQGVSLSLKLTGLKGDAKKGMAGHIRPVPNLAKNLLKLLRNQSVSLPITQFISLKKEKPQGNVE